MKAGGVLFAVAVHSACACTTTGTSAPTTNIRTKNPACIRATTAVCNHNSAGITNPTTDLRISRVFRRPIAPAVVRVLARHTHQPHLRRRHRRRRPVLRCGHRHTVCCAEAHAVRAWAPPRSAAPTGASAHGGAGRTEGVTGGTDAKAARRGSVGAREPARAGAAGIAQ